MAKFTITTSILYPNAAPHMGHALELVQADFLARYHHLHGDTVYFQTGLDEHGLKMQRAADAVSLPVEQFVEQQHPAFTGLGERLGLSHDRFIRTTEGEHQAMAQALWRACAGAIVKRPYRAWYNIKQEEFLGSADEITDPAVFGIDPEHIQLIEEENYFFELSRFEEPILTLLKEGKLRIYPAHRAAELVRFIEEKGLQDVSISREKSRLSWGVPVPDDQDQVMYVWFDALTNYLTGCASVTEAGTIQVGAAWPPTLHCVGKDISRFHGVLWPAMLLAAGLPLPEAILVHGFVLKDGHVMSKSRGNGIAPTEVLDRVSADALRWYLLRALPTTEDGDFSWERFEEVYLSDLANDFGNLVSRVRSMVSKYAAGNVPLIDAERVVNLEAKIVEEVWQRYHQHVAEYQIQDALVAAASLVVFANRRIEECKPWQMAKEPHLRPDLEELLYELLQLIKFVAAMYAPAMPAVCDQIAQDMYGCSGGELGQVRWGDLAAGSQVASGESYVLFGKDVFSHD
jgi:methionyl-tRNA synthetase